MPLPLRTLELFYDVLSPYSWLSFEVRPGEEGRKAEQTQDPSPLPPTPGLLESLGLGRT